jgi:hypothetical protein
MMRITYRYSTGYSWHGRYLKAIRLKVSRKMVAVPISPLPRRFPFSTRIWQSAFWNMPIT